MSPTHAAILSALFLTAPAPPEGPWRTAELLRDGDLTVRLKVKRQATLADREWLIFEFDNAGRQPFACALPRGARQRGPLAVITHRLADGAPGMGIRRHTAILPAVSLPASGLFFANPKEGKDIPVGITDFEAPQAVAALEVRLQHGPFGLAEGPSQGGDTGCGFAEQIGSPFTSSLRVRGHQRPD